MTEGFSGADVAALVNTAVSMVLQEYVAKYPKPEDAKAHIKEAIVIDGPLQGSGEEGPHLQRVQADGEGRGPLLPLIEGPVISLIAPRRTPRILACLSRCKIIGRGTWLDRVASEVLERDKSLGQEHLSLIRVESGLGASGLPHIGSVGDAIRSYGVKMALEGLGYKSELIAYSDDLDGLQEGPRRIPGLAQRLHRPPRDARSRTPSAATSHSASTWGPC